MTAISNNKEAELCRLKVIFSSTVTDTEWTQRYCKWLLRDGTAQDTRLSCPAGFHALNVPLEQSQ